VGRKVHPIGFRLGINRTWESKWFAERGYTDQLHEDLVIRRAVTLALSSDGNQGGRRRDASPREPEEVILRRTVGKARRAYKDHGDTRDSSNAGVAAIEVERAANKIDVSIYTAKPGIVIGKGGQNVERLKKVIERVVGSDKNKKVHLRIEEIKQPELNARLVAESIAEQIGRRVAYRRAAKQAVLRAMRMGAKGIRIRLGGRLGGAEMSRVFTEMEGRVPLHTIRANIDYGVVHAYTTYGRIGVKVWIYKGDVLPERTVRQRPAETPAVAD
jgi:small subunit ribosomal protein S3